MLPNNNSHVTYFYGPLLLQLLWYTDDDVDDDHDDGHRIGEMECDDWLTREPEGKKLR